MKEPEFFKSDRVIEAAKAIAKAEGVQLVSIVVRDAEGISRFISKKQLSMERFNGASVEEKAKRSH